MSTDTINRKPQGIPVGGQYDFRTRPEFTGVLDVPSQRQTLAERSELFKSNAFVPATTLDSAAKTTSTAQLSEWWDRAHLTGEFGKDGKSYKKMGEVATGRSRRTGRHLYQNDDISLRIPNATAIRAQSKEFGNQTFDVPVGVSIRGGPSKEGYVRVTKTGPNTWAATALGGDGSSDNEAMIGEAVTALLESRRVTRALPSLGIGDLLKKRKDRAEAAGTGLSPIRSAFLDEIGYDESSETMAVSINSKVYGHTVPKSFFDTVRSSDSPGAMYNRLIKPTPRQAVTRCQQCFRFTSVNSSHDCPSGHKTESAVIDAATLKDRERASLLAAQRSGGAAPVVVDPPTPEVVAPAPAAVTPDPAVAPSVSTISKHNQGTKTGRANALLDARRLMNKLRGLKTGDKVLVDGKEMTVQPFTPEQFGHPDNKAVLQVGYGPGRYNREVSTAALAGNYVDIRIPEPPAASTHPAPLKTKAEYVMAYDALAQSAANHGLDLAQASFRGEAKASVYTKSLNHHATVAEDGTISRFENDQPVASFTAGNSEAAGLEDWVQSRSKSLSQVTDGLVHQGHYSTAPTPVPVKATAPVPAPTPAHLANPINNNAMYYSEYTSAKEQARGAGFGLNDNSSDQVCETTASTDSYFARIAINPDGSLQRYLNSRPVDSYGANHQKAAELEAWTQEKALQLARITDASRRRRAPVAA